MAVFDEVDGKSVSHVTEAHHADSSYGGIGNVSAAARILGCCSAHQIAA
jgi:hypothetical protein